MRVTVIDYKAGNLTSVVKALRHLSAEVEVTDGPEPLAKAERIVLPGVGHFAATRRLDETGLTPAIREAISRGVPFLGICVGMQWLYASSTEAPEQPGLGQFRETVERFPDADEKVPHVGWNQLEPSPASRLFACVEAGEFAYFTHAWRAPVTRETSAVTDYIQPFSSAVERDHVFGVQFHPEKSGETGLKILRNFLNLGRDELPSRLEEDYVGPSRAAGKVKICRESPLKLPSGAEARSILSAFLARLKPCPFAKPSRAGLCEAFSVLPGVKGAAGKGRDSTKSAGECPSGAKAPANSMCFTRWLKPPPPSVPGFSAACEARSISGGLLARLKPCAFPTANESEVSLQC